MKKCFDPDLGSGLSKWSDPEFGIKHPGSATLTVCYKHKIMYSLPLKKI
jgi:hypothetical protein